LKYIQHLKHVPDLNDEKSSVLGLLTDYINQLKNHVQTDSAEMAYSRKFALMDILVLCLLFLLFQSLDRIPFSEKKNKF